MQVQIDIQTAIFDTLKAGLTVPVYDDVPQEATATDSGFPFVTIGDDTFNEGSTDTELGFFTTLTIHIWSRYAGFLETKQIQAEIYALLNRQTITMPNTDYGIAGITFDFSNAVLDPDGLTRHGVSRFELYIGETIT
tara:strand:+ start:4076 stop:4486 length:411 start_codon:yes stop_codon:yes gene_type:complete